MRDTTRVLFKHRHTHGDMEPVEDVLGLRGEQLRQCSDFLATIGQEGDILIGLQALTLEHIKQSALRLAIVAMHQTDVSGVAVFGHRLANDDLEVGLSVLPVPDVAAIQADHDAPLRKRQPCPVGRATFDEAGPLLREFGFGTLGHTQHVLAQRGRIGAGRDRKDVGKQFDRSGVRHERCPARLQVEPFRGDMVGDQGLQRRRCRRTVRALAPTAMQSWAGDPYVAIEREENDVVTTLAASTLAARFTAAMQLYP
jgi:hypothetical protein